MNCHEESEEGRQEERDKMKKEEAANEKEKGEKTEIEPALTNATSPHAKDVRGTIIFPSTDPLHLARPPFKSVNCLKPRLADLRMDAMELDERETKE